MPSPLRWELSRRHRGTLSFIRRSSRWGASGLAQDQSRLNEAVQAYVEEISRLHRGDIATPEASYYPAIKNLLAEFAGQARPKRDAVTNPAGREGDFPDVAIVGRSSDPEDKSLSEVVVAPVEVKPASSRAGNSSACNRASATRGRSVVDTYSSRISRISSGRVRTAAVQSKSTASRS